MKFSEIEFHRHLVRPGTIIDAGAASGTFAVDIAQLEGAHLVAFEPLDFHFEQLKSRLAENNLLDNVTLHMLALGETPGTAKLRIPIHDRKINTDWGSLIKTFENIELVEQFAEIEVSVTTVDAFDLNDVTAMKIDVEGFEIELLHGAKNTIQRCRPIISCELEERHRKGITSYVPGYLKGLDYEGWFYNQKQFWPIHLLDHRSMHTASESPFIARYSNPYINTFYFVPTEMNDLRDRLLKFGSFRKQFYEGYVP